MKRIFVVGFMLMFAFVVAAQERGRGMSEEDRAKRYEQLKTDLGLNDQQVDSLKAIDTAFFTKMREQREKSGGDRDAMRADMQKMNEERNERVKAILSEEQYKKYVEAESQRRQRGPGGSGGPGGRRN